MPNPTTLPCIIGLVLPAGLFGLCVGGGVIWFVRLCMEWWGGE